MRAAGAFDDGFTPQSELFRAARESGDADAARCAIHDGADVHARDKNGMTALLTACSWGRPAVITALLSCGANAEDRTPQGIPGLVLAARDGGTAAVKALLDGNPAVNATDNSGASALCWAVSNNNREMAKMLLAAGADPELPHPEGRTAMAQAESSPHRGDIRKLFKRAVEKRRRELSAAADSARAGTRKILNRKKPITFP